ncbi:hypothetical protein SAMN04488112_10129 [Melghirimyces thermohalophilus]|uniref:Uncharacterized protein n=1 Tax=Melghirimyces thermohalophilus TaxID=1236220 RepID=A0A1G6HKR5_9BACL|nr:hypothetical protein SAMN04488112_10129 [Melghirimyces thermohalophilus]
MLRNLSSLALTIWLILFPLGWEVALLPPFFPWKWQERVLGQRIILTKKRVRTRHRICFRHLTLRCDHIQYRLRGIWTIPRQYQGVTY